MGEPVELHDVMGRTAGVDNETVLDYEIPAASRSDENVYNTLAETVTPSSKIGDNPSENVNEEAVFKPGTYAFALRKVQIFCLILSVMLVISSVTIGVFIHTLMERTNAAEMKSDEMQRKINELQNISGALTGTDSTSVEVLQGKLIELEKDRSFHTSVIQDHGSRITQLETDVATAEDNIQSQDARLSKVESDGTTDTADKNNMNNTWVQFAMEISANEERINMQQTRLNQIETNMSVDHSQIQKLNNSIMKMESNNNSQSVIEILTSSIRTIETNLTMQTITIQDLSLRLSNLESNMEPGVTLKDITSSLLQLQNDIMSLAVAVSNNSLSINQIKADLEGAQSALAHLSNRVVVNEIEIRSDGSTVGDFHHRISRLEQNNNHTVSRYQNMDSRLNSLEDGLNCTWGNWTSFSSCTATCGDGIQFRGRSLEGMDTESSRQWCTRKEIDIQTCSNQPCKPVNGGWGQWTPFSNCSRTCDGGNQIRVRVCDNPEPAYGGVLCPGNKEETQTCNIDPCPDPAPEDCSGFTTGDPIDGVYNISPNRSLTENVPVYCEFSSDGAWTVIQKRFDGTVDFYRIWEEYRNGFGDVHGEYWLGNGAIHELTSRGNYRLIIRLTDWDNVTKFSNYSTFRIASDSDGYRHTIGDSMSYDNGQPFTTKDVDNDKSSDTCAERRKGGWWYGACGHCNLNGVHYPSSSSQGFTGIWWGHWHDSLYSLKASAMLIQLT